MKEYILELVGVVAFTIGSLLVIIGCLAGIAGFLDGLAKGKCEISRYIQYGAYSWGCELTRIRN